MTVLSTAVTYSASFLLVALSSLYLIYFRPTRKVKPPLVYSNGDESTIQPGHGAIRKIGSFPKPVVNSLLESLQRSVRKFPKHPFLGHRPVVNGVVGDFVWQSYEEAYERIQNFAAGIQHEKMMEPTSDGQRLLCLYMKNRPEWLIAQYGALYAGGYISSLYDTLGTSSTIFILKQTEVQTVICTTTELPTVVASKSGCPHLKFVVLCDVTSVEGVDISKATAAGLKVSSITEIEEIGARFPIAPKYAKLTDPTFLMYTSGTTGDPKGVILSSQNLMTCAEGIIERISHGPVVDTINESATHLSYLPLAHIFEHIVLVALISVGGRIGCYQGNTLKLAEDLTALRPTIFPTVPRLLNKIYDKVVLTARSAGGIKSMLFNWALETKLANLKRGYLGHPFFDKLIFSKIQQKLGLDRCKLIAIGSAPLSPDVMSFFRIALDTSLVEGYGQSEAAGVSTVSDPRDYDSGNVGAPMNCVEMKLISVPDMGYEVTDTTHGEGEGQFPVEGRGEICFRGPTVFSGYYKAPKLTSDAIDADGWLHSGDIGVWLLDGRLKIVDRKKNIFKLSQGEYVAPEKIEIVVAGSELVSQVFVYGDSMHSVLVAIVIPEEQTFVALAKTLGIDGSFAALCQNEQMIDAVHKNIVSVSKAAGLHSFETVKAIKLHTELFSVENDLLTPTFKLKRNEAKKVFLKDIDALYAKVGDLVAGQNVKQA
ncbi:hypothetical protein LEN26_015612 [Aphanomyces euteiches]|nr:hypothetical protein LEN26_015612 [Aphanomyces euteiches]KAH9128953.1 hypothetical protein AeMF1_000955 [Aphanomyces euteiches]KAH9194936.1 hypothetical protein AeNC1_003078 [Aphanomyces euteiches]